MKKFIILTLCLFSIQTFALAQEKTEPADTTELTIKGKVIRIMEDPETGETTIKIAKSGGNNESDNKEDKKSKVKKVDTDLLNLDLGMNILLMDGSVNMPAAWKGLETKNNLASTHVGLTALPTTISLARNYVNLKTGITFDFNRYAFTNAVTLVPDAENLTINQDSGVTYEKNKLIANYLQLPLMLNFQTSPHNKKKNFHLTAGGYAGILMGSRTKQISEEMGKVVVEDEYNLDRFRYGVTGRIGYRALEFYANYSLNSMFRSDQGPDVRPISVGISLTGTF